jgi:hypothetical protein
MLRFKRFDNAAVTIRANRVGGEDQKRSVQDC